MEIIFCCKSVPVDRYLYIYVLLTISWGDIKEDWCGCNPPSAWPQEVQESHEAAALLACGPVRRHPRNVVAPNLGKSLANPVCLRVSPQFVGIIPIHSTHARKRIRAPHRESEVSVAPNSNCLHMMAPYLGSIAGSEEGEGADVN